MTIGSVGPLSVTIRNAPLPFWKSECEIAPINYRLLNTRWVSFPVPNETYTMGLGHTWIFYPHHCQVRAMDMMECWTLQGGIPADYTSHLPYYETG